jgi:transglutaminase-like putative cysteine protease
VRYRIAHDCRILFPTPVREHHCQLRMAPWEDETQALAGLDLKVCPSAVPVARCDGFGNLTHHFTVLGAHREIAFTLTAEVETRLSNPFDFKPLAVARERAWLADSLHQAPRLWDFVYHQGGLTPGLPEPLAGRSRPAWQEGVAVLSQVQEAMAWVGSIATFDPLQTRSVTALADLVSVGHGTAADLAHLLIALLRGWNLPARFVSGYLDAVWFEADDDTPAYPQAMHSWVEVLVPGAGWRGFDPAFGLLTDDTYIRVAVGRDARDVTPLRHVSKGTGEEPEVTEQVSVTRLDGEASG